MEIKFKEKKDSLEQCVIGKSMDLEDNIEDFKPQIGKCAVEREFITISPECVRCNLCVEECPVEAITKTRPKRPAKILDNCVKCEICAQTCPVGCINMVESTATVDEDVEYHLKDLKIPHRILRMKNIELDKDKCKPCGICEQFCPTGAITEEEDEVVIDRDLCVGCGACVNVCPRKAIVLERELGPVIKTKKLLVDQEACVQCQVCEENCPVEAIKLEDDEIVLFEDKCILCDVCSTKCPVGALKLESVADEN